MPTSTEPPPGLLRPHHSRLWLTITWRYCIAFYCVIMLYASVHELVHHGVGYLVCGAWGYKTFNSFTTACEGTSRSDLATYAGPLFSFAAMWAGWWLLRSGKSTLLRRQLGFAMVFAQLPLQRMTGPLLDQNDEFYAASHFFGRGLATMWGTSIVIWAACLPPLVGAYRAIANPHRVWWFLFYLVLFPYLLWGPVFGALEYLLVRRHVLAGTTIGIAHLFILNEVVTITAFWGTKRWLAVPARSSSTRELA